MRIEGSVTLSPLFFNRLSILLATFGASELLFCSEDKVKAVFQLISAWLKEPIFSSSCACDISDSISIPLATLSV